MLKSFEIATAGLDDIPSLCGLLDSLFSQESEFKPDADAQEKGLAEIIANPEVGAILIAKHQGQR